MPKDTKDQSRVISLENKGLRIGTALIFKSPGVDLEHRDLGKREPEGCQETQYP